MGTTRKWPLRYGVAVLSVTVAVALLWIPAIGRGFGSVLFFAVLLSAWYGGLGPGLFATGLTTTIAMVFMAHYGFPAWRVVSLGLFVGGGVGITLLVEGLHRARRRVEASEAWLTAVLTSVGDGVFATDGLGRVTFMNPIAQALTGWTQEEARNQPLESVFSIVSEDSRQPIENPVAQVLRCGMIVGLGNHTILLERNGQERFIDDSAAPIKDVHGRIGGVVLVFRDVTERRRWEETLRKSEERYRFMVERVKEYAIFTLDPAGCATTWNAGVERVLGFSEAEFLDQHLSRFFPAADAAQGAPEQVLQTATALGQMEEERWLLKRDGTRFWASALTTVLRDGGGHMIGFTKVVRDLTDLKCAELERNLLLEREQAARAQAEAANQAKDQFLAVLSHELRTPLTPVLMMVSAMLDDPQTSPTIRPTLEMTRHNVELEARLIDDLLDINRIIQGKMPLRREVVDAHVLMERTVEICREDIRASDLQLKLDLKAPEHHVHADSARLQQVFWNLIKNAVKFASAGGRLSIATRQGAGVGDSGQSLIVEVADTGIGIESELLPRIFDAFAQGNPVSTERRFGGLGLGLAISRSIVLAHGGRLMAESAGTDQGSTFTLELAVVPAPAAASSPEAGRLPEGCGLRLLLVEDDESTLRVMAKLLRQRNYNVVTATSISSALQAADHVDFDLVISDIGLQDGNGLELMRKLRAQRTVKGIALSGFGMDEDIQKSHDAGFVAHLTKPVDFQQLEAIIQRVSSSP